MAFHQVADAIAVVDCNRYILAANRRAQAVFELRDGISVESDRMRFLDQQPAERFDRILKSFRLARCWGFPAAPSSALSVPRPSGNLDWLLQIMPPAIAAPRIQAPFEKTGEAMIFINTTEPSEGPAGEDLTSLFGLSEAQRKIALDLFAGKETAEIQECLGVTRNTLKTHLRRLFEKMGVSRHTELVRVLGKLQPGQQNGNRDSGHPGG